MRQDGGGASWRTTNTVSPKTARDTTLGAIAITLHCLAPNQRQPPWASIRGLIPLSPSHTLTALSITSSLPTCLVACPAIAGVRGTAVLAVLCRSCVLLPAAATRSRLGLVRLTCRPPERCELARTGTSDRPSRTSHDRTSCPYSCRRAASNSLSESLHWPLRSLFPASGDPQSNVPCPNLRWSQPSLY